MVYDNSKKKRRKNGYKLIFNRWLERIYMYPGFLNVNINTCLSY